MTILSTRNLCLTYGDTPLLDDVNLSIETGDRIALVGRNGTGKSTFLKILMGLAVPDRGETISPSGMRIAGLMQSVPDDQDKTIFEMIAQGTALSSLDSDWDAKEYGQIKSQIDSLIFQMNLNSNLSFSGLSGGMKRRVLLAQAIISAPDLLILDEPTNHLDIEAIEWLENFLSNYKKAILFVSHDRAFVKKLARKIFELDRGKLSIFSGGYEAYLLHKAEALNAEEKAWERFDKKLAEEEIWIRQGIKARRTRNEGRVRALEQMRRERSERYQRMGKADFKIHEGINSGKKVLQTVDLSFAFGEQKILESLSLTLHKGDRLGIVGSNGVGKSTLIQLLLGERKPSSGTVALGTNVEVAYLNQLRLGIDPESTVFEAISEGGKESIIFEGVNQSIYRYLQTFLFPPQRARAKVKVLSGGELNRLLLAKLFTKSANFLVLDEPTNDLDLETLELLEDLLVHYSGTLILVSHDRAFLNQIVSSLLVFKGQGIWQEYIGGYDDYLRQVSLEKSKVQRCSEISTQTPLPSLSAKNPQQPIPKKDKLSFKEMKELEALPERLSQIETEIKKLQEEMMSPAFYQQSQPAITQAKTQLSRLEQDLVTLFDRWEALEATRKIKD